MELFHHFPAKLLFKGLSHNTRNRKPSSVSVRVDTSRIELRKKVHSFGARHLPFLITEN